MSEAFEAALKAFQVTGRPNVVREAIAGRIIAAAKLGERDPDRLFTAALTKAMRRNCLKRTTDSLPPEVLEPVSDPVALIWPRLPATAGQHP
jgi:hypothetical protein